MLANAFDLVRESFISGITPVKAVDVCQWAETNRVLAQESSAEPGRYRVERTPYMKEIMDCLSAHSPVREVVFMTSSQVGGSEGGFNWLGYLIDHAPGPTMMVQPSVDLAQRASKQRIDPMIENSPVLRNLVRDPRSRDSGNTILMKKFPAGFLVFAGANSAAGLKQMPVKNLFLDEVDEYPRDVDGQGHAVELAEARTRTFYRKKIFKCSTPTYKGASEIESAFLASDQRYYFVPCPECKHMQHLKWSQVRWDKDASGKPDFKSAKYECEMCKARIEEHYKPWMMDLSRAKWIAQNPGPPAAGFHINTLYSPLGWQSWADMVRDFYKSKDDPNKLKTFINTQLGETFEVKGEDTPEWKPLYDRREHYPIGTVPMPAVILLASCDVQKDRLEAKVMAFRGQESWVIEHRVFYGDTSGPVDSKPWTDLDAFLDKKFPHESGAMLSIHVLAIDSGFNTSRVYEWARKHNPRRVMIVKGMDEQKERITSPRRVDYRKDGKRIKRGLNYWPVGVGTIKADIYGRLKLQRPTDEVIASAGFPSTYVHFPELGDEYFKQLVAEQFVLSKSKTGHPRYVWVKSYPNNEALDLFVYIIAAYYAQGMDRWNEAQWNLLAAQVGATEKPKPVETKTEPKPEVLQAPAKPKQKRVRESSYWR
jgi:phage terminase large subunit GpA-like protein